MKEIKEKPTKRVPRSNAAGKIPKAALKRRGQKPRRKPNQAAGKHLYAGGRQLYHSPRHCGDADRYILFCHQAKHRFHRRARPQACPQADRKVPRTPRRRTNRNNRTHTAGEHNVSPKQTERGTLPDAEQRPRCGADLPRQRAKEKAVTAKTAPRDIRGVTQGQRQLRTAANETVRSITIQTQMQTLTRQVQLAIQKAASSTCKTAAAVRSAVRHFSCRPAQSCRGHCCRD